MKSWSALFVLVWCAVSNVANAALPPVKVEKINDHVYALLGPLGIPTKENGGYMNNSIAILGDTGVILVDTGFSKEIGEHIGKAVATITPKPVKYIINTHHHGDHTLGNIAFPGAKILSAEKCKELVEKHAYDWIRTLEQRLERTFPDTKPVLASETFSDGKTEKTIDGVKMIFWVPAGSHTGGDMMVMLPQDGILITGDIVVDQMVPSFIDAHVKSWVGVLGEVEQSGAKIIIPGHGALTDTKYVGQMRQRMQALYDGVNNGFKKGLTDSETRKTLDLHEWEKMVSYEDLMGGNINRTYLEVEQENF